MLKIDPNQVSVDKGRYQRLVERFEYLAHTKPNLHYTLSVVSQYMHDPCKQHMKAHDWRKHVEVDRFFIKEKLEDKIVEVAAIRTEDELANILTEAASSRVFSKVLDKLSMCDIYAPT
ncbi:unnamed protein product [Prunus armeniaca]